MSGLGSKPIEFEGIRNEAGRNSFYLSVKKWAGKTGTIGVFASAGRYGGTYAHRDIAFEFDSWSQKQLVVLSNLESLNSVLIHQGLPASERLQQLNAIAIVQVRSLLASTTVKGLAEGKK